MPDVLIKTENLHKYATRLEHINCRLRVLDARLDKLYSQVGLQGLFDLVVIDRTIGDNRNLRKSSEYLRTTASYLETAEKNIKEKLEFHKLFRDMKLVYRESPIIKPVIPPWIYIPVGPGGENPIYRLIEENEKIIKYIKPPEANFKTLLPSSILMLRNF